MLLFVNHKNANMRTEVFNIFPPLDNICPIQLLPFLSQRTLVHGFKAIRMALASYKIDYF